MNTVHLILNSHIDPVWLWPWTSGLDTLLNTCRTVCDLLDVHPDIIFTRGEAWAYQQIEQLEPELFDRIVRHVSQGRWSIVGGWWIQPDCNLPSGFAMKKQIELGQKYIRSRFGTIPQVAYNVDSFGHAASLPSLIREAGQRFYVMMRPQEHEMKLPARLFRWRENASAPEVVTFRIAHAYLCRDLIPAEHIQRSLKELPQGIHDTMCFIGIGDHGGAPSHELIQWCKEHRDAIPGVKLIFSSPQKFFDSITPQIESLPQVVGELQMHGVGCYSVHRSTKVALRRAEHLARRAEIQLGQSMDAAESASLNAAWEKICFNHFHDTLGGTCVPSAYGIVDAQLGSAIDTAEEFLQKKLRRQLSKLPPHSHQRIILQNASDHPFEGPIFYEPWLEPGTPLPKQWRLVDEDQHSIPFQIIDTEAAVEFGNRLVFRATLAPRQTKTISCEYFNPQPAPCDPGISISDGMISNVAGIGLVYKPAIEFRWSDLILPRPELEIIEDSSDTWSHDVDRYVQVPLETAHWDSATLYDEGPVMASLLQRGFFGCGNILAEYRVYAGEPFVELLLRVTWIGQHRVLKLTFQPNSPIAARVDGTLGGHTPRDCDAKERPMQDFVLANLGGGRTLGIVAPDVFALDGDTNRLRFTLLRSPVMAHHVPHVAAASPRAQYSDQGSHEFRFRIMSDVTVDALGRQALSMHRPPLLAESTLGMSRPAMSAQTVG